MNISYSGTGSGKTRVIIERKIIQWRLATMGRLTEMNVVNWTINENGDSEYSLI